MLTGKKGAKDENGNIDPSKIFKRHNPEEPEPKSILPGVSMRCDDSDVLVNKLTAGGITCCVRPQFLNTVVQLRSSCKSSVFVVMNNEKGELIYSHGFPARQKFFQPFS